MFFSTATRPTFSQIGRGRSRISGGRSSCGRGRNSSVSTPRDQGERLRNPFFSSSLRKLSVATMIRPDGPWNQRMKA